MMKKLLTFLFCAISVNANALADDVKIAIPQLSKTVPAVIDASCSDLHSPNTYAAKIDGGEAHCGCLGCATSLSGRILKIFPESDLNRFGVQTKDKIVGINSHKFRPFKFQRECVGLPGSPISLDVIHDGALEHIVVNRVDSRLLSSHAHRYEKLSKKSITW